MYARSYRKKSKFVLISFCMSIIVVIKLTLMNYDKTEVVVSLVTLI